MLYLPLYMCVRAVLAIGLTNNSPATSNIPANTTEHYFNKTTPFVNEILNEQANTHYEPPSTTDEYNDKPAVTTNADFYGPEDATAENPHRPATSLGESFYEPPNTFEESFDEPPTTTDDYFYELPNTTDDNFHEPTHTTDDYYYEPATTTDDYLYEPATTTDDYLHEKPYTTDAYLYERLTTNDEYLYEPATTTDDYLHEKPYTTDVYLYERLTTTDENLYEPATTTDDNFHEPTHTTDDYYYEPATTTDNNLHEQPYTTDNYLNEPATTTDDNFHEQPYTTDVYLYERLTTNDEYLYEPATTTDDYLYEPATTTDNYLYDPATTTDDNFHEQTYTTDNYLYDPATTTDDNFHEQPNTTDAYLYERLTTNDDNFHEQTYTTDDYLYEPATTTDDNFHEQPYSTDGYLYERLNTTDEYLYEPATTTDDNLHEQPYTTDNYTYESANTTDAYFHEQPFTTDDYFHGPQNTSDWYFYDPENIFDEYNDKFTPITIAEVEELLRSPKTRTFLSQFAEGKRVAIRTYLFHCPYAPLCGFSFNLTLPQEYESTCLMCRCASGCAFDRSCCPDILPDSLFQSTKSEEGFIYKCPSSDDPLLPCDEPMVNSYFDITGYCYKSGTGNVDGVTYVSESLVDYVQIPCQTCFDEDGDGNVVDSREILELSCPTIQPSIFRSDRHIVKDFINDKQHICSFLIASQTNMMISNICVLTVSTCNTTGLWSQFDPVYSAACSAFYAPFIYMDVAYSNLFCVLCNGFVPTDMYSVPVWYNEPDISFEGTLKPDTHDRNNNFDGTGYCEKEEIYNPPMDTCLPASCSPTRRFDNGVCVKVISRIGQMTYDANFRLFPENQTTLGTSMNLSVAIITWFRLFLDIPITGDMHINCSTVQLVHAIRLDNHHTFTNTSDLVDDPINYIDISTQFTIGFGHDPDVIYGLIESFHGSTIPFGDATSTFQVFIKDTTRPCWLCSNETDPEHFDHVTEAYSNGQSAGVSVSSDGHLVVLDVNSDLGLTICETGTLTSNIVVFNPCPRVRLDKEKIKWDEYDKGASLTLNGSRIEIDSLYYFHGVDEASVLVCNDVIRVKKRPMDKPIAGSLGLKLHVPRVMITVALFHRFTK